MIEITTRPLKAAPAVGNKFLDLGEPAQIEARFNVLKSYNGLLEQLFCTDEIAFDALSAEQLEGFVSLLYELAELYLMSAPGQYALSLEEQIRALKAVRKQAVA